MADTKKPVCGYQFEVKGRGVVRCLLKLGHVSKYHEHRFDVWTARHTPAQRHYFTHKDGARLPKEVVR